MPGTTLSVPHTSIAWSLIKLKDFTFHFIRIQMFKATSQSRGYPKGQLSWFSSVASCKLVVSTVSYTTTAVVLTTLIHYLLNTLPFDVT